MVNWKAADATDRLLGSLIAAHPGLKLDYSAMAAMFGRGATYDSIEGRFRSYRKIAEELKSEATARGVTTVPRPTRDGVNGAAPRTPRTPRGPRNGVTKTPGSIPSRSGKRSSTAQKNGKSIFDAISLDGDGDSGNSILVKSETGVPTSAAFETGDSPLTKKDPISESSEKIENDQKPQLLGNRIKPEPRVDSRTNGYVDDIPMTTGILEQTATGVGPIQGEFGMSMMENVYFGDQDQEIENIYDASAHFTIIVTFSNTGIGKEAGRHLVRLNVKKVIIAVRSIKKGEAVKAEIEADITRTITGVIEVWELDYSSYASVKAFAAKVAATLDLINAVVLNAGIATQKFEMFEDNESSITVNVISSTLLIILRSVAEKHHTVPVIAVASSVAHSFTSFPERETTNSLSTLNDEKTANMSECYQVSKLLQLLAAREIAERTANTNPFAIINIVDPGLCHTDLTHRAESRESGRYEADESPSGMDR
ncbi:hypothetical protein VTN00DRAFT_3099 [Thermoascus crustaceus]|uniref:uncharacterized protein n=1 Tax=Thermoascus crustaceus TaxID=5088 RepID=UPI0037428D61